MMEKNDRVISIFGNSRCSTEDWEYREAESLGRLLGKAGYVVSTGGYAGVMEAASRGAKLAGGEVLGVTVDIFSDPPNPYLTREIRTRDLHERLRLISQMSYGFIALRGGIGTVTEVALIWNLLATKSINPSRPFVLIGPQWDRVIHSLADNLAIGAMELAHTRIVKTAEEAVAEIDRQLGGFAHAPPAPHEP